MSVVCAMRDAGGAWLGCDTLVSYGETGVAGYRVKWLLAKSRPVAIGITGINAGIDIITDHIERFGPEDSPAQVWRTITDAWKGAGWDGKKEDGKPGDWGTEVIFATPARVVSFCTVGGSVTHGVGDFISSGSGGTIADGAAFVERCAGASAHECVRSALNAAMRLDRACGGEPWMHHLKQPEEIREENEVQAG